MNVHSDVYANGAIGGGGGERHDVRSDPNADGEWRMAAGGRGVWLRPGHNARLSLPQR